MQVKAGLAAHQALERRTVLGDAGRRELVGQHDEACDERNRRARKHGGPQPPHGAFITQACEPTPHTPPPMAYTSTTSY